MRAIDLQVPDPATLHERRGVAEAVRRINSGLD
jgi:hypothetical protein